MRFNVISEVLVPGIGKLTDEHSQEFSDSSTVFERVLNYRHYMYSKFPGCEFRLIEAKRIKEKR